jgi:hypothetical protein
MGNEMAHIWRKLSSGAVRCTSALVVPAPVPAVIAGPAVIARRDTQEMACTGPDQVSVAGQLA